MANGFRDFIFKTDEYCMNCMMNVYCVGLFAKMADCLSEGPCSTAAYDYDR